MSKKQFIIDTNCLKHRHIILCKNVMLSFVKNAVSMDAPTLNNIVPMSMPINNNTTNLYFNKILDIYNKTPFSVIAYFILCTYLQIYAKTAEMVLNP